MRKELDPFTKATVEKLKSLANTNTNSESVQLHAFYEIIRKSSKCHRAVIAAYNRAARVHLPGMLLTS